MNSIPSLAAVQSLVTIGVVVLLWSLHARLVDRAVFRWWAWAWTCYGLYLGLGTLALPLTETWTPSRVIVILLAAICGFLTPAFLIFGARSVEDSRLPTSREQAAGLAFAPAAALLVLAVSLGWSDTTESYYVRLAPRTAALSAALLYCAWIFLSQWKRTESRASLITGIVCLLYGATQGLYAAALVARVAGESGVGSVVDPIIAWRARLFWIDQAYVYGTSIGLVLLFVEDYQQSQQALQESTHRRLEVADQNLALQAEIEVRKRTELALQRSEEKFATAFRSNPCAMAITLLDGGTILDVNDVLVRQSGYERGELVGKNADDVGFWIESSERIAVKSELESRGRVATREVQWRAKDGRAVTVLYSADTLEVDGRRAVLSVAEDITSRKRTEHTHQAVLKAIPDWIFVLSTDGVFVDFHAKDTDRLAMPPPAFLGRHVRDVLPPDVANGVVEGIERAVRTDETATFEYTMPTPSGTGYYEARLVRCGTDKVLSIVRDISERRHAELQARELRDELAHVGRVTTLAALTGSLAHEINQPLAAIMTNAQAARRLIAAPVPDLMELRAALADIVSDNQRAADVVRRLRSLLRKDSSEYAPLDLNDGIQEVIKVLHGDIAARRITVDVQLDPNLPLVVGDRVQLQQVTLNLLMNAFDAVEREEPSARRVSLRTSSENGEVTVAVLDEGVGLTDEQLPRVFEPFYTTKPDGMGLGLPICQMIATAHDGTVSVERRPDRGSMFFFTLPTLARREAESDPPLASVSGS